MAPAAFFILIAFFVDLLYATNMKSLRIILAIAIMFVFVSSCTLKSGVQETKPLVKLFVFECGENNVNDISMFAPDLSTKVAKKMIVSCFLIQHPHGTLLWDSGLSDDIAKEPKGVSAMNGNFHLTVKKPFLKQLAEMGVSPKDITYVAFSHFHADHVGNANAFVGSTLLIQKDEYEAAFGAHPEEFRFAKATYQNLKKTPVKLLLGDHDVFGDGSVVIKRAIGHTPGHQVLFVRLSKTGPVVLSGDLYHFAENREKKRVPAFNFSKEETLKSMDAIEAFIRDTHATMWIQHDYEQIQALRHAPNFYE